MSSDAGYGTPPFAYPYPINSPDYMVRQTPPIEDVQTPNGQFVVTQTVPPQAQAGTSIIVRASFTERIDGACGGANNPWTVFPSVAILDGNGNAASNVTIGTVTAYTGVAGSYFSVVQLGASLPPGNYVVQWKATYTPINTQEPQVPLPVVARKAFRVTNLKAPSQFYFLDSKKI